jgi:phenylpyruvate tautomerase PptA (4-oxalocrotonate tautomerase family)
MPLVRIDLAEGRAPGAARAIADAVHAALVAAYRIPDADRFQLITERPAGTIIAHDAGLGFERRLPVIIQIFTQRGRSEETRQRLYAEIAQRLESVGVAGEDLLISYFENGPPDWSLAFGRAQFLTGELALPAFAVPKAH